MPRSHAKRDNKQTEIVRLIRDLPGVSVAVTHKLGKGFPDYIVACNGYCVLVEHKTKEYAWGHEPKDHLTKDERLFRKNWKGPYICAYDDDMLDTIVAWRNYVMTLPRGKYMVV